MLVKNTVSEAMSLLHPKTLATVTAVLLGVLTSNAQTGVTIGDTAIHGASMLNVKPTTPAGPGLSVGDSAHITAPAPANGASIQGDLLIGTNNLGNAKVAVDGTGKIVSLEINGKMFFIDQDKGIIQKSLDGKCWILVPEPQPDGLTALPKYYLVNCPY